MKDKRKYLTGIGIVTILACLFMLVFSAFVNANNANRYVIDILDNGSTNFKENEQAIVTQEIIESESTDTELTYQLKIANKEASKNKQVALLVDTSYSIGQNADINAVKQLAKEIATGLTATSRVSVSNTAEVRLNLTNNNNQLNTAINNLAIGQGHNLADGIDNANNTFVDQPDTTRTMVIITDSTDNVKDKLDALIANHINVITITTGITNNIIGTPSNPNYGSIYMFDTAKANDIIDEIAGNLVNTRITNTFTSDILKYFDIDFNGNTQVSTTADGFIWTPGRISTTPATLKYKLKLKSNVDIDRNIIYKDWYAADVIDILYNFRGNTKAMQITKEEGPRFTVCETYKMKIKAVSTENKNVPVEGIVFDITGTNEKGEEVYKGTATTDAYGYITVDGLKTLNIVEYFIEPKVNVIGYTTSSPRTIKINNDYLGKRVIEMQDSDGLEYTVDDNKRIVELKYPIDVQKFDLEVNLTELNNNTVTLAGVEFRLIQPKVNDKYEMSALFGTTDNDGKIIFHPTVMTPTSGPQTYEYILSQMTSLSGYTSMGNVTLRVTFDSAGNVKNIEKVYNANVEAIRVSDTYAVVNVGNESDLVNGFNFELNLTDSATNNPIGGANYNITVIDSNGATYNYGQNITDANGKINMKLPGTGYVTIKVTENSPATGYAKNPTTNEILIQRINGTVNQIVTRNPSDLNVAANPTEDKVTINLESTLKKDRNIVKVEVIDKDEIPTYYIPGVEFTLTNIDNGKTYTSVVSDNTGVAEFTVDDEDQGIYRYKVEAINLPYGYEPLSAPLVFNVEFDGNRHIINTSNISGPIDVINANVVSSDYDTLYKAYVQTHLAISSSNSYIYEIDLRDSKDSKIAIEGATYDIDISAGAFSKKITGRPTDANGKIQTRIFVDKTTTSDIQITATETKSIRGYKCDAVPQEFAINLLNNTITHTPTEVLPGAASGLPKYATISGNKITYHHTNKKKDVDDILLNLSITTIDYSSKTPVGGKKVKIKNIIEREREHIIDPETAKDVDTEKLTSTDPLSIGNLELNGLKVLGAKIPGEQLYLVDIEVDGNSVRIQLKFKYNEEKDIVEVINVETIRGNRLIPAAGGKNFSASETNNGYESDVNLQIYTDYDATGNVSLDLIKKSIVDKSVLTGAKYEVIVERPDGTKLVNSNVSITNDIEYNGLYVPVDSVIYITETTAPQGYSKNDTIVLRVTNIDTYTGETTIVEDTSTSSYTIPRTKLTQKPSITLASGTVQSVYDLEMFDMEEDVFTVQIDAQNAQGNGVSGAKFKLTSSKGAIKTSEQTNGSGEVSTKIGGRYDDVSSPITYTIENIQAGTYYKKLANPITINAYFTSSNEIDATATLNGQTDSHYVVNGTNPGDWYFVATNTKDNNGNIITDLELKVIVEEQDPLKVEIETVDKFTNQKITSNVGYGVKNALGLYQGTLDATYGTIKMDVKYVLTNGTETYSLIQNVNDIRYIALDNLNFTITYDANGDIDSTTVITNNPDIKVMSASGKSIKLRVLVEPAVPVTFENSYYFDHTTKLQGGQFEVIDAQNVTLGTATTDANGKGVAYSGKFGTSETIRYTIKQTKAATGYATVEPFEIEVDYTDNREISDVRLVNTANRFIKVSKIQPSTSADYGYTGNDKGIVKIEVFNYPEMIMNIENVDRQNNTIKLAGTNYSVTSNIGTADNNVTTDADGIGIAHLDRTKLGGSIIYTINEKSPAVGYQSLCIEPQIEVFFNADGYVERVNILKRDDVTSYSLPTIVDIRDNFKINIKIQNNLLEKLNIHKVDKVSKDPIAKVDFEVTARIRKDDLSNYTDEEQKKLILDTVQLTDDQYLGEVIDRLKINQETVFDMKKDIVVEQYVEALKNSGNLTEEEEQKVTAGVNGTDKINILISLNKLTKGQSNNLIKEVKNLEIINKLIENKTTTQSAVNDLLNKVKSLVRLDVDTVTTDVNGNAIAYMDKTLANKTVEYTIKETRKPDGYDWPDEMIILEITYDSTGKMVKDLVKKISGEMNITNINEDAFSVDLEIGNKPSDKVEIHLTTVDVYDTNKKLETAEFNAYLTNSVNGVAYTKDTKYETTLASNGLASTGAHGEDISSIGVYDDGPGTRVLRIDEIVAPTTYYEGNDGHQSYYQSIKYKMLFNVTFNDEGSITDVSLHKPEERNNDIGGWNADSRYLAISHTRNTINITIRYYPMVQLVMETPDKYTGDLLGARYTVSTSSRPRGHLTQADVIKSGYIGENHYWGIHEDEYYRGDVYQTTYTTSVNNPAVPLAVIESEEDDLKGRDHNIRRFYIYEEAEPTSPVQYQKYRPRNLMHDDERLIGTVLVKYNQKGEVVDVTLESEHSNNNIKNGFVTTIIPTYIDNKHTIKIEVKYAPITTVLAKAEDTTSKAGIEGVRFYAYDNPTPVTETSYEYRTEYEYVTNSNGNVGWTYWGANIDKGMTVYKIHTGSYQNYSMKGYFQNPVDKIIEVEVAYGDDGRISSAKVLSKNTFNEPTAYIDESCYGTTQLKLIYKLERKVGVQINKKDRYDSNINLSAKFRVTSDLDTSIIGDVDFIINTANKVPQIAGRMLAGKTVEYTLSEVTVPDGYIAPSNNLKIKVTYGNDGTVQDVQPADDFSAQYITVNYRCTTPRGNNRDVHKDFEITVTNEPKLGLEIQMLDKFYNNIPLENVTLEITNDQGDTAVGNLTTNASGSISTYVGPVYPDKTVTYTIKQVIKASGYYQLSAPIVFTVTYDSVGKAVDIPKFADSYSQEYAKILSNNVSTFRNTHTARLQIYNMPEDVKIGFTKYDELTNTPIPNVQFKITVEEDGNTYDINDIVTNSDGLFVAKIDTFKETATGRTVTYTIKEMNQPDTYRKVQDLKVMVVYAPDGGISSWMEITNDSNLPYNIYARGNTNITKVDGKYVHIDLKVPNDNTYDVIVKDEDSTYNGLGIEGTTYDVSIAGVAKQPAKTDVNGYTKLTKLTDSGNFQIVISERNIGDGYRSKNLNSITLEMKKAAVGPYTLELDTGNMTNYTITDGTSVIPTELVYNVLLDQATNTYAIVTVDETYGTVKVVFKNEPMLELTLLKQDINTKKSLEGVKFEITSTDINTGETKVLTENTATGTTSMTTDNNGKIYFDLGISPKNTTIEYTFKELEQPEPTSVYTSVIAPQKITVAYDMYGKIISITPNTNSTLRTQTTLVQKNTNETETESASCKNILVVVGNGTVDPKYRVKIASEDATTGRRINGSVFDVEITDSANNTLTLLQNGITSNLCTDGKYHSDAEVIEKGYTILERGITKTNGINKEGKVYIHVDQLGFSNGYIAGTQKTNGVVELTTQFIDNPNGSLDSILKVTLDNNDGFEVNINEASREITIVVKNESRTQLNITKVSTVKEEIKNAEGIVIGTKEVPISGANFTVTSEILTATEHRPTDLNLTTRPTGADGKTSEPIGEALAGKGVIYTIHENELTGYHSLNDIIVYVLYDAKGYIKECELLSSYEDATLENSIGTRQINLKVRNQPNISDYRMVIEKHGIDDNLYPELIAGVEFNIKLKEEYGQTKEWNAITSPEGIITSDYFDGYGNISIVLTETSTIAGYKINPTPVTVLLTRNKNTGKIEKTSSDLNIDIDQAKQIIYLKPVNEFANNSYALTLDKVDAKTGEKITENHAKFDVEITQQDREGNITYRNTIEDLETDDTGRVTEVGLLMPEKPGEYIYQVKEKQVPTGYSKDPSDVKYKVTFAQNEEGDMYISSVEKISGEYSSVLKVDKQVLALRIGNIDKDAELEDGEYEIDITKVDESGEPIEGTAVFKITAPNGTVQYLSTEGNSKIYLNKLKMPAEEGTVEYKIQEIMAPDGYILDKSERTLKVEFKLDESSKMKIVNAEIVGGNANITIIEDTHIAIDVVNLVGTYVPPETSDSKYNIILNKLDKNKDPITKPAKFEIALENGQKVTAATDSTGKIVVENIAAPATEGRYLYVIKEIEAPEGYKLDSEFKALELTFTKVDEEMVITNATIATGNNVTAKVVNDGKGAEIDFVDELDETDPKPPVGEDSKYNIVINKVDKDGNAITKLAKFKITLADGTERELTTDEQGKITLNDIIAPTEAGTHSYVIKEIEAPEGYKIDAESKVLELTFAKENDQMVITSATISSGRNVTANIINSGKEVSIDFANELDNTDPKPPIGEDGKYHIIINKVDTEGNAIAKTVKFKITLEDGTEREISTNEQGKILLEDGMATEEGTRSYVIKEIEAPEGYKLDSEEKVIEITFKMIDGNMTISDAKIKTGQKIAVNIVDGEVVINIINEKNADNPDPDNPDPDKPDPDKPGNTTGGNTTGGNTTGGDNTGNRPNNNGNGNNGNSGNSGNGGNKYTPQTEGFDIQTKKYLTSITQIYSDTNEKKVTNIAKTDKTTKLDVNAKRLQYLSLSLEYKIIITNVGSKAGIVDYIQDRMPNNMSIDLPKNRNWTLNGNIITYDLQDAELKPGESREATIILKYDGSIQGGGSMINYATFISKDQDVNSKNDIGKAEFIISIKTGQEFVMYSILTLTILVTFGTGVYYIKKYVI